MHCVNVFEATIRLVTGSFKDFGHLKQDVAAYASVKANENDHDRESNCFEDVANYNNMDQFVPVVFDVVRMFLILYIFQEPLLIQPFYLCHNGVDIQRLL